MFQEPRIEASRYADLTQKPSGVYVGQRLGTNHCASPTYHDLTASLGFAVTPLPSSNTSGFLEGSNLPFVKDNRDILVGPTPPSPSVFASVGGEEPGTQPSGRKSAAVTWVLLSFWKTSPKLMALQREATPVTVW